MKHWRNVVLALVLSTAFGTAPALAKDTGNEAQSLWQWLSAWYQAGAELCSRAEQSGDG